MRLILIVFLLFCTGFLSVGLHVSEISGPVKNAGNLEIVTEQPIPVVKFAAKELQAYRKQATGAGDPDCAESIRRKNRFGSGRLPECVRGGDDVSKLPARPVSI